MRDEVLGPIRPSPEPLGEPDTPEPDLHHHGDSDIADGLVDLAVNVRVSRPPSWLSQVIVDSLDDLAAYPRPRPAAEAIAAAHGVDLDHVLPTAGGAEAFTLLARALQPRHPVVVHPQFTEPEAALLTAGHQPHRLILRAEDEFRLDPALVPDAADLVMIGNPTNPTSVLHRRSELRQLVRPGRIVVVDEAFMDAVPDERETLIGGPMAGVVVLRSLTKTWGLAGLRVGYAVGDPFVLAAMRVQQPPWSVSTPAIAAIIACSSTTARQQAQQLAVQAASDRFHLARQLRTVDLLPVGQPAAPFILLDSTSSRPGAAPGWLRLALRDHGFAVRRGETFPGLTADWIRVAVREPAVSGRFVEALRAVLAH